MKRYEYVTFENSDLLQQKHKSTIQLYSYNNYRLIGCIPYKTENGADKVDLVFEKDVSSIPYVRREPSEYGEY